MGWEYGLESQVDPTRVLSQEPGSSLPAELELADFELLSVLGEGAQGRVYLAREKSLDNRPVVLKVTPCRGREHFSLARLQHTHIMPLYWAHDDIEANRRTLCMPFLGTLTLDGLLRGLERKSPSDRTGRDILDVLDQAREKSPVPSPANGPARLFLEQANFTSVMCWVGRCLADALQYAHERGLVHLDLKPSNVLIAGDGQPMLLDFHLAREPIPMGGTPRGLGGTPQYMAPEQRDALDALVSGKPCPRPVDVRADIYSLGLVLYQALGGPLHQREPCPRLDHLNSQVSRGLADIIHHCLERDPDARYPTAAALSEDLRRHLADQKLLGVPNRDVKERWVKWRRRSPHAFWYCAILLLFLATIAGGGFFILHGRHARHQDLMEQLEANWKEAQRNLHARQYDSAIPALERAALLAEKTARSDWQTRINDEMKAAQYKRMAANLHRMGDQLRFESGSYFRTRAGTDIDQILRLWDARHKLSKGGETEYDVDRQQVQSDLMDIVLTLIDLHSEPGAANNKAASLIEEAEAFFGPSAVLLHEKMHLAESRKDNILEKQYRSQLSSVIPVTAWDHYLLGRHYLRRDKHKQAKSYFDQAIALQPDGFWPHFYQGICALRLGDYSTAVSAYRAALVAQPQSAEVYFNRGIAYAKLGKDEEARSDFTRVQQLNSLMLRRAMEQEPLAAEWKLLSHLSKAP